MFIHWKVLLKIFLTSTDNALTGGDAYCDNCYSDKILPKCAGCKQPISDRALKAFDTQWHVKCFVCEVS